MNTEMLLQERKQKDEFFQSQLQSPLTPAQKAEFDGLSYYDPKPDLALTVTVQPFEMKEDVQIQTTTGEGRWYRRYGEFTFTTEGQQARLTLYQTPHGFFLPFADANAGKETYGAGRYLDPEQVGDNTFLVDFNQAYNPFCAYNDAWVCPITPAENRLQVAVRAGEKIPSGGWIDHI